MAQKAKQMGAKAVLGHAGAALILFLGPAMVGCTSMEPEYDPYRFSPAGWGITANDPSVAAYYGDGTRVRWADMTADREHVAHLCLRSSVLKASDAERLSVMPELRHLELNGCRTDARFIDGISSRLHLTFLAFTDTTVPPSAFSIPRRMESLKALVIEGCDLAGADLAGIREVDRSFWVNFVSCRGFHPNAARDLAAAAAANPDFGYLLSDCPLSPEAVRAEYRKLKPGTAE